MLANFILDYFRLMIGGSMNSHEIEALMDEEIETCEDWRASGRSSGGDRR